MSSKTKNTTTKEEEVKPALVPKLRFPEFRGADGWEEKRLGNEGELYSSLTGKAGADFDAGEARFVTYMNVFSNTFVDPKALRFVDVKEGENQNAVASGDVFFTISSETPDEVGMSSVLLEDLENCYLNSFCALFRFSESKRPNPVFTGYLLRQPLVRAYFTKKAQGSTRFNLSKDAFRSLPLCVPSPAEQQKIAECLISLDELMAAQARKVDALKTHKKGLMQQLFPHEGETQPCLRFPEFQNAGEWASEPLGNLGEIVTGKTPSTKDADLWGGDILFITPTDISEDAKYQCTTARTVIETKNTKILPAGSVVYTCIASIGKMALTVHPSITNQQINAVVPNEKVLGEFIYYALANLTPWIKTLPATNTLPIINKTDFSKIGILLPENKAEQQRIADCLTSLDDLIAAQTQKHEALKTHKKSLMQQLFPSPEDVEA
jgi:type I restriction enzyme S subunit